MTIHDDITDTDLIRAAATSLSTLPIPDPPSVETIMARGHRCRYTTTGLALTASTALAVLALSLATVVANHSHTATATATSTTIRTAAFTLTENTNGTATLRLTGSQMFDPATLQQALRQDHIPALVTTDSYCTSNPSPGSPIGLGVITTQLPDGAPLKPHTASRQQPVPDNVVTVIDPAPIPAGAELFFNYVRPTELAFGLINTKSRTCQNRPPTD
jgi:hypothetical protein